MKPIFFNSEMVRAIFEGKTQTRRVIKPQPKWVQDGVMNWKGKVGLLHTHKLPYRPGQILWVRETWQHNPCRGSGWPYDYKATPEHNSYEHDTWRPSIHMPREAARLFLLVKAVRVERLQEILCGDMRREGCIHPTVKGGQYQQWQRDYWIPLWDSLNAKRGYGWDTNPWVWVVEFERTEAPS